MVNPRLRYIGLIATVVLAAGVSRAAIYDYAVNDGSNRALRLNMPDDLPVVRGILSWGNGGVGDSRGQATSVELVPFARAHGFCVVATSGFDFTVPGTYDVYMTGLDHLAAMSGHPELNQVPWMPLGHSNGGIMSYLLAVNNPTRTLSFAISKAVEFANQRPPAATLAIPGLLVAGELDTSIRVTGINSLYDGNRPRGGLWAWAEEQGVGHEDGEEDDLERPIAEDVLGLRYPESQDAKDRSLRPVDESSGWLVDTASYKDGWARIYPYADYPGDRRSAGWLPTKRSAYIFRAFASYNKATTEVALISPTNPRVTELGAPIGYQMSAPPGNWTTIEFYEGSTLLARKSRADAADLSVTITAERAGYSVFHAVVAYADGTFRTTPLKRVFINPSLTLPRSQPAPIISEKQDPGSTTAFQWTTYLGATGYRLERSSSPTGPWTRVAEVTASSFGEPASLAGVTLYYRVTALWNSTVLATSELFPVTVPVIHGGHGRLTNLSVRAYAGAGESTLIVGLIHYGGNKRVLIRAIGPGLVPYGVTGTLPNPKLRLVASSGAELLTNDDWGASPNVDELTATTARLGGFPLQRGSLDAAVLYTLSSASAATTALTEAIGAPGVALAEVYDADPEADSRLVNLSARGLVLTESGVMIIGIIIGGNENLTVLFRAAGPALRNFGLSGVLANPTVSLHSTDRELHQNDNWGENANTVELRRASSELTGFTFPDGSLDAGLLVTLVPGAYTLVISGANSTTGVALAEAYAVP